MASLSLLRSGSILLNLGLLSVCSVAVRKIKSYLTEAGEEQNVDKIKIPLFSNIGKVLDCVTMCVLCLAMDRHISQRSDTLD